MNLRTLNVTELNQYIKRIIHSDPILNAIKVEGEITAFKKHSSGHAYFLIKDDNSRINCVLFSNNYDLLDFVPKDGDMVEIFGKISVYEKNGTYQLYVNQMKNAGIGNLFKKFNDLKLMLENEGLFNPLYKKTITKYPQKIAVITSRTGAAIHDVLSVIQRRNPLVDILIIPASVQGENTVKEVLDAFDYVESINGIDTVILTRGGGSYEELFNFNDEAIARRIFKCKIPVISAIGHEIDFTISDFVADLRAPTPSAAAELATEDIMNIIKLQKKHIDDMAYTIKNKIHNYEKTLNQYHYNYLKFPIVKKMAFQEHQMEIAIEKSSSLIMKQLTEIEHKHQILIEKINGLNPLNILSKGYSRLKDDASNDLIFSIDNIIEGQVIRNELKDGHIISKIIAIEVSK
ncbi:MAG: exodeoxyribonuclease VII large subunit [Clostridiales bacterium]|nr:exodeoxyribonuclease VII large subunit [Clostridiales bacterium]